MFNDDWASCIIDHEGPFVRAIETVISSHLLETV